MIRSFRDKRTEAIFDGENPKGFPASLLQVARRKLAIVDAAGMLQDLKTPPGNRLHPLKDDREDQHAIWINSKYRVCFVWRDGDAYDVEVIDYH